MTKEKLEEAFKPFVWSGASYIGIEEVEMMRDNPKECVEVAMEYAKQKAIAFAKFLDDLKVNADKHFNIPKSATTEQLFDLFDKDNL